MMIRPTSTSLLRAAGRSRIRPAFTLVEVLVVMVILVIIAGAATFAVFGNLEKARVEEAKIKAQKIEQAALSYYALNNDYPADPSLLINPGADGSAPFLVGGQPAILDPWGQPYTMQVSQDNFGSTRVIVISSGNGKKQIQWPAN